MKFKPPKTVKVLGNRLRIVLTDVAGEGGRRGQILFWKDEIQLDKDNAHPVCLLHELIHAIEVAMNWEESEDHTQQMTNCLAALIADNPRLIHHLADVLGGKP